MGMSQESFCAEIWRENAVSVSRGKHFVRACAVEMHKISQNADGQVTRGILCLNLQGKCQRDRYHLD